MNGNKIFIVYKDKTTDNIVGVNAIINGIVNDYNISDIISSNIKFDNAIICKNGVIRGKNCSLDFRYINNSKRNIITVYHGSPNYNLVPTYGKGEDKHDYGRGFYLTQSAELAKEWAVNLSDREGYLHTFSLDLTDLRIFNFNEVSSLSWFAELMSHRDADSSARYKKLSKKFIELYKLDISSYDIIYGWRADSSYFSIAKRFVRNEIDYNLISELFHLGELDNQICLKSKKAFLRLTRVCNPEVVDKSYGELYSKRDTEAREMMNKIIESDRNTMQLGFDYVIRRKINE